ncbi:NAD-dependent epimerase/dehydratase family protein [Conexibacter sp. W3-3-2]|uniref:Sugar dehydratase n=1 Tax=Paraconexibacter algicola TaxID=2133960 RepID=A0A2T4UCB8_9ACTN|nr:MULTISPECIES: NAD-dependent epimerase/dehydratase family protein [Solirubrobacterales]MTD43099.1 NAD-dependent epimerase/dehydratase family protein [Conexibacter sp. W3-3-2]PTL54857.1 sugar dehydratase [Paraconexibacter algicola]
MTFGEQLSGKTAFVTGAYGMLGSWLVRGLLDHGARVVVLKRDQVAASALALDGLEARCQVVRGDLVDANLMDRALGEYEVDAVFHLAAQTIVGTANRSPASTFDSNIRGTWTLLEACRHHQVSQTVVAASDKAYGPHDTLPYKEDFALQPKFPYDVSKAATDLIARSYFHTYGLPVAVTRFANIYGGGDLNPSRLIPEMVSGILAGRAPVIRSDGSPERDFLYVEDAVAAYLAIADELAAGRAGGEAFNAGGDAPHSVREIVDLTIEVVGSDVVADYQGAGVPDGEIDRQYVDSTKLRELTGWAPQVDLREGLRRTVEWYRAHPEALSA